MYSYNIFLLTAIIASVCAISTSADEATNAAINSITSTDLAADIEPTTAKEPMISDEQAIMILMRPNYETLEQFTPQFFSSETSGERQHFNEIFSNGSISVVQIADQLKQWTTLQGPQIRAFYDYVHDRLSSMLGYAKAMIANSSLSDAAKQAFANITEIIANSDQSINEEAQQIKSFIQSLPEDVRDEMLTYVKSTITDTLNEMKQKLQ